MIPMMNAGSRLLIWLMVSTIVFPAAFSSDVAGQERVAPSALADFVLSGWESERERLHTAQARIEGRYTQTVKGDPKPLSSAIDVTWTLDTAQSAERYDIHRFGDKSGAWMDFADRKVQWQSGASELVNIRLPDADLLPQMMRLDPRVLSWGGVAAMNAMKLQDMLPALRKLEPPDVETLTGGRFRVSWNSPLNGATVQTSVVVLEKTGFAIELHELEFWPDGAPDEKKLGVRTITKWEEIAGVWLPVEFESDNLTDNEQLSLTVNWTNVNQPLDAAAFDVQHIGAPEGVYIVDHRIAPGDGLIVGKIGDPDYVHARLPEHFNRLPITSSSRVKSLTMWVVIVANLLVILFFCGFHFHRRRYPGAPGGNQNDQSSSSGGSSPE